MVADEVQDTREISPAMRALVHDAISLAIKEGVLLSEEERAWLRLQIERNKRRQKIYTGIATSFVGWLLIAVVIGIGTLAWEGARKAIGGP